MLISDVAAEIVRTKTAHAIRRRRTEPEEGQPIEYDAQPFNETGNKKGWILLDAFTASIMCQVYENISPKAQESFNKITLYKLIDICWKAIK